MKTSQLAFWVVLTLSVPMAGAFASDAQSINEAVLARLTALEKRVEQLETENKQLRGQLGYDGKAPLVVAKPAGKESKISIGGYMQVNAETGGVPDSRWAGINDRVLLRRARLAVTGSFAEKISFKLEGDFGNNSISGRSGYSAQITDAYVTWTPNEMAAVRLGQFKTPFGYEQLLADTKTTTVERSLPNDRLTVSRQIGAGVFGDLVPKKLSYSVGLFNGNGVNNGNNDNDQFLWVGRLNGVLAEGGEGSGKYRFAAGINAFTTRDTGTFTGNRDGFGLDAQCAFGPAEIVAEWLRNEQDPLTGSDVTLEGWSIGGAYLFQPRWQGVLRYETYDSNTSTANTTTRLWTIGGSYLLKGDDLKLTLNYVRGKPAGATSEDDRLLGRFQIIF
jgi:phosphate-selective porin OprO and OprP